MGTGINPQDFNLINSQFNADGTGFDQVLDITQVNYDQSGKVTIVTVDSQTNNTGETIATISPDTAIQDLDTYKAEINERLAQLKNTINSNGCGLQSADLEPYFEDPLIVDGKNLDVLTKKFIYGLGCQSSQQQPTRSVEEMKLLEIEGYNADTGVLSGKVMISWKEQSGVIFGGLNWIKFKKSGGDWIIASDGHVGEIEVEVIYERQHKADGSEVYRKSLFVWVGDYLNIINSIKIFGPGMDIIGEDVQKICDRLNNFGNCWERDTIKEFQRHFFWDRNDGGQPDWYFTPYAGAVYTLKITKNNDTPDEEYKITLLPAPEQFAYPEFRNLNPSGHSLVFTYGKMVVTGEVFTPVYDVGTSGPFVTLWDGDYNSNWGNKIGEIRCEWRATPELGRWNPFSCEIPETVNGQQVKIAHMGKSATSSYIGGTNSVVTWDFVR